MVSEGFAKKTGRPCGMLESGGVGLGGEEHDTTIIVSTNHVKQVRRQRPLAKLCINNKTPSPAKIFLTIAHFRFFFTNIIINHILILIINLCYLKQITTINQRNSCDKNKKSSQNKTESSFIFEIKMKQGYKQVVKYCNPPAKITISTVLVPIPLVMKKLLKTPLWRV